MLDVIAEINDWLNQNRTFDSFKALSLDERLAVLIAYVGAIAWPHESSSARRLALLKTAGCAFAWLAALNLKPEDILLRISEERTRQRELFAQRIHLFRTDSPVVDWKRKLRVLTEEVGEVAEAIDRLERSPKSSLLKKHFVTELIQVAAVLVAWLESLAEK